MEIGYVCLACYHVFRVSSFRGYFCLRGLNLLRGGFGGEMRYKRFLKKSNENTRKGHEFYLWIKLV